MAEKSFLKKSHTDKVFILSDVNLKEFYEFVPPHQLLAKYGGDLPELETFWFFFTIHSSNNLKFKRPPVNTIDKFFEEKKEKENLTSVGEEKKEENPAEFSQSLKEIMLEKKRIFLKCLDFLFII